jgi:ABC-type enterochelin transport system permease subunit|tara:strand:- start:1274 stop:1672 length:399 start_codon:yes stop_codon:yes gene_type:complete
VGQKNFNQLKINNMLKDKELRGYLGAATVFLLVMGLLLFLAFFEIPDTNNDIFKVIVGMLVGSLSVVIYTFIGKNPEEVQALKAKNEALEDRVSAMVIEKDKLELLLRDLQTEVIDKLAITGETFKFTNFKK